MNYEIFGSAIQTVMPDRGLRRRGFASGVEVPVQDLDAYVKGLFNAHDPRTSLFTERTWAELGITLGSSIGGFRMMAPIDADGGGAGYLFIAADGQMVSASMVFDVHPVLHLAGTFSGATSFTRWPTAHVVFIAGKPRHSIDNGVSFSSDWTQTGAQNPLALWLDESGQVIIIRDAVGPSFFYRYPTLADAAANTNSTVLSQTGVPALRVFSKIAGDVHIASNSGDARYFRMSGLSIPTFPIVASVFAGSFVGGFEHQGGIWWKETTGAKRIVNHNGLEITPFTWTTHQAFFKCGAYMFDLSDNILRYSIDGEEWLIHSSGRANSDVQAAGRRLFYSSDSSTYVHKFTGLL